jgi:cephalosporin hydroxylase
MNPSDLYEVLLDKIRKTLLAMSEPQWRLAIEDASPEEQKKEAKLRLKLEKTRLRLENAQLENILKALTANEQAILDSTAAMEQALANLQIVKTVLSAGAALVAVAVKIIGRLTKP